MVTERVVPRAVALLILTSSLAWGAPPGSARDEVTVEAARRLGQQGVELYQEGKYADAVERLERAYAVVSVPTLGLWSARALEKAGRLLDAYERYQAVVRYTPRPGDPAVFADAVEDARREVRALEPRVPKLVIEVDHAEAKGLVVDLDGRPVPPELLGVALSANPGRRTIGIQVEGSERKTTEVDLPEGAVLTVELSTETGSVAPDRAAQPATADGDDDAEVSATTRTLSWVAIGVGGAGLIVGTVFGVMALSNRGTLRDGCRGDACPPSLHDEVDAFERNRLISGIGFGTAAVSWGVGLYLLLAANPEPPADRASVTPLIGPGSLGMRGTF